MDTSIGELDGRARDPEQESFLRDIASQRTYLLFVAGQLAGASAGPSMAPSDLVDSVLADAFAEVRNGDGRLTFRSTAGLNAWLVQRLRWRYLDRIKRRRISDGIIDELPKPAPPPSPESEIDRRARMKRLAEARARLNPEDREIIAWHIDEKLTFEEIGRRRGYSSSFACRKWGEAIGRLGELYRGLGRSGSG